MESVQSFSLKNFIITAVCGFVVCLIVGILFFRGAVFILSSNKFIYTAYGILGGLVFAAMFYRNTRDSLIVLAVLFILNIIIIHSHYISFIIRDVVAFSSLWLSIYIYKNWFYNSSEKYKYLRAFGFGIITALIFFVAGIFLLYINVPLERISVELCMQVSLFYLQSGMLIGLGLGLGFDLAELIISKTGTPQAAE